MNEFEELKKFWEGKEGCEETKRYINELQKIDFVPFIGAGMSVDFGYPTWDKFLSELKNRFLEIPDKYNELQKLYEKSEYLELAEKLDSKEYLNKTLATKVCERFGKEPTLPQREKYFDCFLKTEKIKSIVTTNFDKVIENNMAFDEIFSLGNMRNPYEAMDSIRQNKTVLIKLHGTCDDKGSIILTKQQYDSIYKSDIIIEMVKYIWVNSVLLFMGCGLNSNDYIIKKMKDVAGEKSWAKHYAILEYPKNNLESTMNHLDRLHIKPIWYEQGKHGQIIDILKMILGINEETQGKNEHLTQQAKNIGSNSVKYTNISTDYSHNVKGDRCEIWVISNTFAPMQMELRENITKNKVSYFFVLSSQDTESQTGIRALKVLFKDIANKISYRYEDNIPFEAILFVDCDENDNPDYKNSEGFQCSKNAWGKMSSDEIKKIRDSYKLKGFNSLI